MKSALRKSAIVFLAVMLVMTTGGFSIYQHFCKCAGETTESLFVETTCDRHCGVVNEPAECCNTVEKKSCCTEKQVQKVNSTHKHDDCCNSSSKFIKISDNFRVTFEKVSFKFFASFISLLTGIDFISEPHAVVRVVPDFNDTSPPLYGTELLHHIHQLKLDQSLV